jgi:hypothetical protein
VYSLGCSAGSSLHTARQMRPGNNVARCQHKTHHGGTMLHLRILQDWRPMLDEAVQHFRDAGCAPPDIRGALKNHYRAADLDLGPDPEPQPEKVTKQTASCANISCFV